MSDGSILASRCSTCGRLPNEGCRSWCERVSEQLGRTGYTYRLRRDYTDTGVGLALCDVCGRPLSEHRLTYSCHKGQQ